MIHWYPSNKPTAPFPRKFFWNETHMAAELWEHGKEPLWKT